MPVREKNSEQNQINSKNTISYKSKKFSKILLWRIKKGHKDGLF